MSQRLVRGYAQAPGFILAVLSIAKMKHAQLSLANLFVHIWGFIE
jgi:hypothetical protein